MDTLDIGKAEEIKSIPSYFGTGEKQDEEEDIPDMDTYEDTGDNSVMNLSFTGLSLTKADKG
jgi:ubiquitin-like-conjugating enzyme ATG3